MEITEVKIKLMDDPSERLKAFCSIMFDGCFVVRDLKIIEGVNGPFVAMPSRKMATPCPKCRAKNHAKANFCNQCGSRFNQPARQQNQTERPKFYADIAHPINALCREMIQEAVLAAYEREKECALQPGYACSYDDFDDSFEETNEQEAQTFFFDSPHKSNLSHAQDQPAPDKAPNHKT